VIACPLLSAEVNAPSPRCADLQQRHNAIFQLPAAGVPRVAHAGLRRVLPYRFRRGPFRLPAGEALAPSLSDAALASHLGQGPDLGRLRHPSYQGLDFLEAALLFA